MRANILTNKLFSFDVHQIVQAYQTLPKERLCDLAISFAESGKKVLLIDCDFRNPKIHQMFSVHNIIGLSSILMRESTLEETAVIANQPRLCIIPTGPYLDYADDLLASQEMMELIQLAEKKFDAILLVL
jgi:Mrp family chromosome partitioning ATPase